MSKDTPARRTLADVIMDKIRDKKTEIESQMSGMLSKDLILFIHAGSHSTFFYYQFFTFPFFSYFVDNKPCLSFPSMRRKNVNENKIDQRAAKPPYPPTGI